jgi:hypothetical protein
MMKEKGIAVSTVSHGMRYMLMIVLVAALIWLGSLLWQMLQGTGNTF